jgi:hypothetical protein
MPSPSSRECWNPAVPPPPVAGAAVGNGLGVAEGLGVGLTDGVGAGVIVGLGDGEIVGLTDAETVGLAVPGENGGGAVDPDPEQAEIAAAANKANATQPAMAKLARRPVPLMVACSFMTPPHALAGGGHVSPSRFWRGNCLPAGTRRARGGPKAGPRGGRRP